MPARRADMPQSVSPVAVMWRPVRKEVDRIGGGNLAVTNKLRYPEMPRLRNVIKSEESSNVEFLQEECATWSVLFSGWWLL